MHFVDHIPRKPGYLPEQTQRSQSSRRPSSASAYRLSSCQYNESHGQGRSYLHLAYHVLSRYTQPGKNPACIENVNDILRRSIGPISTSKTPRRMRQAIRPVHSLTKPIPIVTTPHMNVIPARKLRGPSFRTTMVAGNWKMM